MYMYMYDTLPTTYMYVHNVKVHTYVLRILEYIFSSATNYKLLA